MSRALTVLCWCYALVLALLAAGLRLLPTLPLLELLRFFPFAALALPLVLFAALALRARRPLLALPLAASSLLLLGPLMGLVIPLRAAPAPLPAGGATLRLLTWNVWRGFYGADALRAEVLAERPDVVVFQLTSHVADAVFADPYFQGFTVRRVDQFSIASRYPVLAARASTEGITPIGAPFAVFSLQTPLGALELYSVHTLTPRYALDKLRGGGLRSLLGLARLRATLDELGRNAKLRDGQLAALASDAAQARAPVLMAGDFNEPGYSSTLARDLAAYADGFSSGGAGFGYTFPADKVVPPWMRLDRVLAGPQLRVARLWRGRCGVSTHCPVIAEIVAGPRGPAGPSARKPSEPPPARGRVPARPASGGVPQPD